MLDREVFLRPIAHRGLHDITKGRIENTMPAFEAAIARGYAIECDLQPLADGTPVVFHDETLDRLIDASGRIDQRTTKDLAHLAYKAAPKVRILTFAELLDVVAGAVPLFVEIKSDWTPPRRDFLERVGKLVRRYKGPLALMSFDPAVMTAMREIAPKTPRGIVSGRYQSPGWWLETLGAERGRRLTDLLESGPAAPSFYSYHVKSLPTPVTEYVRKVQGLPVICWTVRTVEERRIAKVWADAPTFEGYLP
jgi:glycerophosphoryl diester phosphodiesterase